MKKKDETNEKNWFTEIGVGNFITKVFKKISMFIDESRDGDDHKFIHAENKVIYGKKSPVPDCNIFAYCKGKRWKIKNKR